MELLPSEMQNGQPYSEREELVPEQFSSRRNPKHEIRSTKPGPLPFLSFPGSAWERRVLQALRMARRSLASSSFPGRAWKREKPVPLPFGFRISDFGF